MMPTVLMRRAVAVSAVLLLGGVPLQADEKKEPDLYMTGDLAFFWTSGNSKANSLGLARKDPAPPAP